MPTQLEAAQMAANVYGNLSSVRTDQNTIAIPTDWSSDAATHPEFVKVDTGTGFMARAYQRGNETMGSSLKETMGSRNNGVKSQI
jgi:hypothetical protein